jgi:hypothetical protein
MMRNLSHLYIKTASLVRRMQEKRGLRPFENVITGVQKL